MTMNRSNELGNIIITKEAIASLSAESIKGCYGVVGMAAKNYLRDQFTEILKHHNYSKGIVVRNTDKGIELDVYIILAYGVKVTEVTKEVQRKIKYDLENTLDIEFASVNVFVQSVKSLD